MEEKLQHSKLSFGTSLPLGDGDTCSDPAKANRSVSVIGIPEGTSAIDLVVHFQRRKNGGGDIEEIVMNKKGSTVITFDKAEGKVSVADCSFIVRLQPSSFQNYRPISSVTSHHVTLRTGGQASVCLQHGGESDYEAWVVTRLF